MVGGRVVSNGRKIVDSRDERCLVCAINRLQISMDIIIEF